MTGRLTETGTAPWFETAFGRFYADLYAHRNAAEAEALLTHIEEVLPPEGPVLDLGCGAGRLLGLLGRTYPDAIGLDLSSDLLRLAREALPGTRLLRADMRRLPIAPDSVRAVFSLFTSFGYFENEDDDRGVIGQVASLLAPRGVYVLDFLNARRVVPNLVPFSSQTVQGRTVESSRRYDPESRVISKHVRVLGNGSEVELEYVERVRAYTSAELDRLIEDGGLRPELRLGSYEGGSFDEERSTRYIVVARKESS